MGMAQQMLGNPGLQSAMANPAVLANPMMQNMMQQAISNPDFMRQALQSPQIQQMMVPRTPTTTVTHCPHAAKPHPRRGIR